MKIAIIGGGSYTWGPALLGDLALSGRLRGSVYLLDTDARAGERLRRLGRRAMEQRGVELDVIYTAQPAEALEGADYAVLSITTGGLEAMRGDLEIPETYGIHQAVGDTVGPGGLARGLRNIPVVADIARRMERLCPRAWLINLTNPLGSLCCAVSRASEVRVLGLCHEVQGVQGRVAGLLGPEGWGDGWRVAGVNHLPWLIGADPVALARLEERVQALPLDPQGDPFQDNLRVKLDLLGLYGTFPAAGDRHVAEFFPHYLRTPAEAFERYGVRLTRIHHREVSRTRNQEAVSQLLADPRPLDLRPSGEQVVPVIESLAGLRSGEFVVDITNEGHIPGLPEDVVVECLAVVDGTGVHPQQTPKLPSGALSWVQIHAAVQDLVVAAALERRPDLALQALLLDPLCHRLGRDEADHLLRALEAHNARYTRRADGAAP